MTTNINSTRIIIVVVAAVVAAFSMFLVISLYQQTKTLETKFNREKAALIKEGMDLQDRIDALTKEIKEKTNALPVLETENKAMLQKVKVLEVENKKLSGMYARRIDVLKKEKDSLERKIESIKNIPVDQLLKEALANEKNKTIKTLLEGTLSKIEMVKSGKAINLEPIIVKEEGASAVTGTGSEPGNISQTKTGKILSLDRDNNLIVLDMGRSDNVKDGQRCIVLKDNKEVASGDIISTRYKISAVFINNISYNHTMKDIKEGDNVLVSTQ